MHFEVLVEDKSGKKALDIIIPKIIDSSHTFCSHAYKGVGRIPKDLKPKTGANKRILLDRLPQLLKGYGKSLSKNDAVIVVCDLDKKNKDIFLNELNDVLNQCTPKPTTRFCLAIEESEAWMLGDIQAIKTAYPKVKISVLNNYINDSICNTWEKLADAIYPGGSTVLSTQGYHAVGIEKSVWAKNICPHMNIANNKSPSFNHFLGKLCELITMKQMN